MDFTQKPGNSQFIAYKGNKYVQFVKKVQASSKCTDQLGVMEQACHSRALEAEACGSRVLGQPQLHWEVKASLTYRRPCLNNNSNKHRAWGGGGTVGRGAPPVPDSTRLIEFPTREMECYRSRAKIILCYL